MQDYSDVPDWIKEEFASNRFVDALLDGTTAVIARYRQADRPLLGLALDIKPRQHLIELSLLFDPSLKDRSQLESWDCYHITADEGLTSVWQPVRNAFKVERLRWQRVAAAHPKGGALFVYTLLGVLVFNLDFGSVADALDLVPAARDMQVFAVNYEDPTLPNVFAVEHKRVTLIEPPQRPAPPRKQKPAETEEPWVDSRQLKLF